MNNKFEPKFNELVFAFDRNDDNGLIGRFLAKEEIESEDGMYRYAVSPGKTSIYLSSEISIEWFTDVEKR